MLTKLILSIGTISFGLILGYTIRRLVEAGKINLFLEIPSLSRRIQRLAILFFMPVPTMGAIWVASIDDPRIAVLPLICIAVMMIGGFLGWLVARILGSNRRQTGALYCCGSFSNMNAMGVLVGYIFLGEGGLALVALFRMFEELVYYGIGFPIARSYGRDIVKSVPWMVRLRKIFTDPFICVSLSALFFGIVLNISGIQRPSFFATVNAIFVPVGTLLLLASIGMGMHFSRMGFIRESLAVACIKFIAMPVLAVMAASLLRLGEIYGGLPLKAVLIGSSMPVAFNSLIAASLYDLDLDLANSCWFFTTCSMVFVLPSIYLLLEHI